MDVFRLHNAIAAVAPIFGVSPGDPADKSTWAVSFKPEATDEQIAAAQDAISDFEMNAEPVPESIPLWKARAVLGQNGLLAQTDSLIEASGNTAYIAAWHYAPDIHRTSPLVNWAGQQLNLTSAQIDALFIAAAAISV